MGRQTDSEIDRLLLDFMQMLIAYDYSCICINRPNNCCKTFINYMNCYGHYSNSDPHRSIDLTEALVKGTWPLIEL